MYRDSSGKLPIWAAVIIVIVAIAIAYLPARLIHNSGGTEEIGSYRMLSGASAYDVKTAGDGFVYYDGATLAYMTSDSTLKWTYMIGSDVSFTASPYGVAAWSGNYLTLINLTDGSTIYSGTQDEDVVSASVSSKYLAILIGESDDSQLIINEYGGRLMFKDSYPGVTVLDYGFYSGGSLLWVMTLDTSGTVPDCVITTYKPGNQKTVGSISDNEQMMYHAAFMSEDICCVGVTYMKVYSYTSKEFEDRRKLVYGYYMAACDECDDPLMAFVPHDQYEQSAIRDVRLLRSDVDSFIRMPFDCIDVFTHGSEIYGVSQSGQLMKCEAHSKKVKAYQLPFTVDKAYGITNDGYMIASSGSSVYIISLGIEK